MSSGSWQLRLRSRVGIAVSLAIAGALLACRESPPAAAVPAPAPATASAASVPGVLHGAPARIAFGGGAGEVPDTQVAVRFENAGDTRCELRGYQLRWGGGGSSPGGGTVRCAVAAVEVPARGVVETTCTVPSRTQLGATPGMKVENTTVVEILSSCDDARPSAAGSAAPVFECVHHSTRQPMRSEASCEAICQKREGSCFFGKECLDQCNARARSWDDATRQRFFDCALCNPLCHEDVDLCLQRPPVAR
jgi:hypothetical protein